MAKRDRAAYWWSAIIGIARFLVDLARTRFSHSRTVKRGVYAARRCSFKDIWLKFCVFYSVQTTIIFLAIIVLLLCNTYWITYLRIKGLNIWLVSVVVGYTSAEIGIRGRFRANWIKLDRVCVIMYKTRLVYQNWCESALETIFKSN